MPALLCAVQRAESKPVLKQCWTQMGRPMEWVCMNRPSGGWNSHIPDLPSPSPTAQINTQSQKTAPARDAVPIGLPRKLSQLFPLTIAAGLARRESMQYFYPAHIGAKPNSSELMTNLKLETRHKIQHSANIEKFQFSDQLLWVHK